MGIDKTDEPRTDNDVEHAIKVVNHHIVTGMTAVPPELYLELTTIRESLLELIKVRGLVRQTFEGKKNVTPRGAGW